MSLIRFRYKCTKCRRFTNNLQDGRCAYCGGKVIKRPIPKDYEESLKVDREWNRP